MSHKLGAVVTTIQRPTSAVKALAEALDVGPENRLFIVGDAKGPREWELMSGCNVDFWSLETQSGLRWSLADLLKENSYARKNLGYLLAMQWGAECIYETDDDTMPKPSWRRPAQRIAARSVSKISGVTWVNPYTPFETASFFGSPSIWPRGYPLDEIPFSQMNLFVAPSVGLRDCPIQNGLVDVAPDVDALWRLLNPNHKYSFAPGEPIAIEQGFWAPFNSQNTWWYPKAFPLMYLPTYCSIRMVDIWRGYIAQRCLWVMGKNLAFRAADVTQDRNEHDLRQDFLAEVDGYTRTKEFCKVLSDLDMIHRADRKLDIGDGLRICYRILIKAGFFDEKELELVDAWLGAIDEIRS